MADQISLNENSPYIGVQGLIQNLRFWDGRNLGDIFSCLEFTVVRLDIMNGVLEWAANVL